MFPPDERYKAEYSVVWDSNSAFVIGFVSSMSFTLFFFFYEIRKLDKLVSKFSSVSQVKKML